MEKADQWEVLDRIRYEAVYRGRAWAGDEPRCEQCARESCLRVTGRTPNVYHQFLRGYQELARESSPADRNPVFVSAEGNACDYVSSANNPAEAWKTPYHAVVRGRDTLRPGTPGTFHDVINWFSYHPFTGRQIDLPAPSCLQPVDHHYNVDHSVVLALPSSQAPDRSEPFRARWIDDRP